MFYLHRLFFLCNFVPKRKDKENELKWKTGKPDYSGEYIITNKYGQVETDRWDEYKETWVYHHDCDVMAWCDLFSIKPYSFR